jgi:hypothetical protein
MAETVTPHIMRPKHGKIRMPNNEIK